MTMLVNFKRSSLIVGTVCALTVATLSPALAHGGHGGGDHGGFGGGDRVGASDRMDGHGDFDKPEETFSANRFDGGQRSFHGADHLSQRYRDRNYYWGNDDDDDCYPEWNRDPANFAYREAICPDW